MGAMASAAVIGLVLILDLLAFVLAIGAERRRSTVSTSPPPGSHLISSTRLW
jgi:hypothetical protein